MNNNQAWEELFRKYDILGHIEADGRFIISADQIREYREPRLMTKFDHRINLPSLFSKNELSILPITRGDYVIAHYDAYHKFEADSSPIIKVSPPYNIQSLDYSSISSEAIALNCAFAAGIIQDFFDDDSMIATVHGRMGTGTFSFRIHDTDKDLMRPVSVVNSQMEIDAAYEGRYCMAVIEAKREISDDFIIRQLYYPFRVWHDRITKPVIPVFFVYSNNIFSLYEYTFESLIDYNSIALVRQQNYSVEDTIITAQDIQNIMQRTRITIEPEDVPFPQADKIERVLNLCELLREQDLSKQDITEQYAFDSRQADYYANAARYLGLIEKNSSALYSLSKSGRRIMGMNYRDRQLALCEHILSHRVFHKTLRSYFTAGHMPDTGYIIDLMKSSGLYNISSEDTFRRRAGTVRSWLNWIAGLITE